MDTGQNLGTGDSVQQTVAHLLRLCYTLGDKTVFRFSLPTNRRFTVGGLPEKASWKSFLCLVIEPLFPMHRHLRPQRTQPALISVVGKFGHGPGDHVSALDQRVGRI